MKYSLKLNLPPIQIFSSILNIKERGVGVTLGENTRLVSLIGNRNNNFIQQQELKKILNPLLYNNINSVNLICVRTTYPHTHLGTGKSAINWYLETNGETTSFYEGDDIIDVSSKYFSEKDKAYIMPDPDKLKFVESFVAKENESWLIDVSQPHSVCVDPNEKDWKRRYGDSGGVFRLALHVSFNLDFKTVRNNLSQYGTQNG